MSLQEDTIAAIATPHGIGGIGIIRISGPEAEKSDFACSDRKSRTHPIKVIIFITEISSCPKPV